MKFYYTLTFTHEKNNLFLHVTALQSEMEPCPSNFIPGERRYLINVGECFTACIHAHGKPSEIATLRGQLIMFW